MSDYWSRSLAGREAWHHEVNRQILEHLEAAAEDTRQRDLTRSLGQVECRGLHEILLPPRPCHDCKAVL